ncbi:MAG: DUF3365 domain-containing protein [Chloroflexi bacterium]|nr:MAG: DUF3365 domain-containing protein [Chloroflexota bacterium]MBL1193996.1 DUF3365 domain-containing protein [Chloroflexota bacterium]NOH11290.1 DUF3365 domain-containing protein [Chloroflexota bacterium]
MLRTMNLSTRFTVLLLSVLVAGVIVSGVILWGVLEARAEADVTEKGLILTETMNAVRSYTSNNVSPQLQRELAASEVFIAETVPAFSAREVFENFRADEEYANFFYKEATLNPVNPRSGADGFEAELVEQMRNDPNLTEVSGFREREGAQLFFIARPLSINDESCLACHSDPAIAPANLVATYGDDGGFGWELDEIVAAQVIYVPAEDVFNAALRSFFLLIVIFVAIIAAAVVAINFLIRRDVVQPVGVMGGFAQKLGEDEIAAEDLESTSLAGLAGRQDELGVMAQAFQRMMKEVYTRTQALKKQLESLRIEIDAFQRDAQVQEVTDSEFFQDLKSKAQDLRKDDEDENDDE